MNKLYNILKWAMEQKGWNVAPFAENTFDNGERTLEITIGELQPVQQGFDIMEATITFTFINGNNWEENSLDLWEALTAFIPISERIEALTLPDYSNRLTILETPQFSDILTEQDENTGNTTSSVTVTFTFNF